MFSTLFSARSLNCVKNRVCYRRDLSIDVRKIPKIKIFSEFREKFGRTWVRPKFCKSLLNLQREKIHVDLNLVGISQNFGTDPSSTSFFSKLRKYFCTSFFLTSISRSRLYHTRFLAQFHERAETGVANKRLPPLSDKFSNNHPHI